MPWVRFSPEAGKSVETEREVFLRGVKKSPDIASPRSPIFTIFVGRDFKNEKQN